MDHTLKFTPTQVSGWRVELVDDDGDVLAALVAVPSHSQRFGPELRPVDGARSSSMEELFYYIHGADYDRFSDFASDKANLGREYHFAVNIE